MGGGSLISTFISDQTARNSPGARAVASITVLMSRFPVQAPVSRFLPSVQNSTIATSKCTDSPYTTAVAWNSP